MTSARYGRGLLQSDYSLLALSDGRLLFSILRSGQCYRSQRQARVSCLGTRKFHLLSGQLQQHASEENARPPLERSLLGAIADSKGTKSSETSQESLPGIRERLRAWSAEQAKKGEHLKKDIDAPQDIALKPNEHALSLERPTDEIPNDNEDDQETFLLNPGDAVEISQPLPGSSTDSPIAIFIRRVDGQEQFLLEDGRWAVTSNTFMRGVIIPRLVPPASLDTLIPHLPSEGLRTLTDDHGILTPVDLAGDIPRDISAPFLKEISNLQKEAAVFRRQYAGLLERSHEILADEHNFKYLQVEDYLAQVLGRPIGEVSKGAFVAISKVLQKDPLGCAMFSQSKTIFSVLFTPKKLFRNLHLVQDWARQYQESAASTAQGKDVQASISANPLSKFIDKARRIILKSRKLRSPTTVGSLGPALSKIGVAPVEIDLALEESDHMIIDYIWNAFLRIPNPATYNKATLSIGSVILRAIGAYPNLRLGRKIAQLLLQELGVRAPWAESADDDVTLPVPEEHRYGGDEARVVYEASEKAGKAVKYRTPTRGDTYYTFPMVDTLAKQRHDWDDMLVVCIDDRDTSVLEDGFSIEEAREVPGAYWLHIHVAHPSAYLTPDHIYTKRAKALSAHLYIAQGIWTMLPQEFSRRLAVGQNRACLTISGLIAANGEIKETKIVPGIIRNIVKVTSPAVDSILGLPSLEKATMSIGNMMNMASTKFGSPDELACEIRHASEHRRFFETAQKLARARLIRRVEEFPNPYDYIHWYTNNEVVFSFAGGYRGLRQRKITHFAGDPAILVRSNRHERLGRLINRHEMDTLIMQVMSIGCEIAAKWCSERRIPSLYIGSYMGSKLTSGGGSRRTSRDEKALPPKRYFSAAPVSHFMINCNQYMKCTSPLRRFTDLVCALQIDAVLRHEAEMSQEKLRYDEPANAKHLAFSKEWLEDYADRAFAANVKISRQSKMQKHHWILQAFFRAVHFKEAVLPEVWDICVENVRRIDEDGDTGLRGRLLPFHVEGTRIRRSPEGFERDVKLKQYLPCKIELVDVERGTMFVKPVGYPSDEPTIEAPANIGSEPVEEAHFRGDVQVPLESTDVTAWTLRTEMDDQD